MVTISKRIVLIETKRIRRATMVAMSNCWATVQIPLRKMMIMLSQIEKTNVSECEGILDKSWSEEEFEEKIENWLDVKELAIKKIVSNVELMTILLSIGSECS